MGSHQPCTGSASQHAPWLWLLAEAPALPAGELGFEDAMGWQLARL